LSNYTISIFTINKLKGDLYKLSYKNPEPLSYVNLGLYKLLSSVVTTNNAIYSRSINNKAL